MVNERFLIVNADGYGFTPGVNKGVIDTFEAGLVKSTSCTPNFGFLGDAGATQRQFPDVSFGIHFNLTVGKPMSPPNKVRSLLGPNDEFVGADLLNRILRREACQNEMEIELTAQAAILADQGVEITHFDGHQNRHLWPVYFTACLNVAKRFGIKAIRSHRRLLYANEGPLSVSRITRYYATHPLRVLTHIGGRVRTSSAEARGYAAADRLITPGYADDSHKSLGNFWTTLAATLPRGYSEIYCHPGYPDDILRAHAKYVDKRADEVRILSNPTLMNHYSENNIRLISFHDLIKHKRNK